MADRTVIQDVKAKAATSKGEKVIVLEEGRRLSQSMLWDIQRNYFEREGVEAWRQGTVPHYITSNAFIADVYARILLGFMRDCREADGSGWPRYDRGKPIYVVELGCGHGRFAYHLLKKLHARQQRSSLAEMPFTYVMTDLCERNVRYWQSHESLMPLAEAGLLDFARFDPQSESHIDLIRSGVTLSAENAGNPTAFIANYFFDSIPMDAFYVDDGTLYERLTRITSPQEEPDAADPGIFTRMAVSYEKAEVQADYYDDPEWNRILDQYIHCLTETAVLFPTGALECVRNIERLSRGRMLLVSADRGDCRMEDVQGWKKTKIAVHGSISLRVNYHAIGQYVINTGGTAFQPRHHPSSLAVSAFALGNCERDVVETGQVYGETVDEFGPDDFFTLKKNLQENCEDFDIEQALAFLRLSGWDAKIFMSCFSVLMQQVETANAEQKREVLEAARRVWDIYFPLGEKKDVAFKIGTLLCQMEYFREALEYFEESVALYGEAPGISYNMALCYDGLGDTENAVKCVDKALELNPDFGPALEMQLDLEPLAE